MNTNELMPFPWLSAKRMKTKERQGWPGGARGISFRGGLALLTFLML